MGENEETDGFEISSPIIHFISSKRHLVLITKKKEEDRFDL